jgi:hypothetical protein
MNASSPIIEIADKFCAGAGQPAFSHTNCRRTAGNVHLRFGRTTPAAEALPMLKPKQPEDSFFSGRKKNSMPPAGNPARHTSLLQGL